MMQIGMSNGVEYARQLWKLFARSVASYALVCWSRGLNMDYQKLRFWVGTIEQTIIIGVAGNIKGGMIE